MFRMTISALLAIVVASDVLAAGPTVLPVWPDLDKSLVATEKTEDHGTPGKPAPFIKDVSYPTLTVYLPEEAKGPTPAVVICPGGGYLGVSIDKEGSAVARWLNSLGVAGLVLKYRFPHPEVTKDGAPLPLTDAREALRLARAHAKEWNLDPDRVGIMGFSAGGHLASTVITHPAEDAGARADFAVLVYPVISMHPPVAHKGSRDRLLGTNPTAAMVDLYSNELQVTDHTVPTFLVHAKDDKVLPRNSVLFYEALQKHHVPSELHLLESGGHGFGLGANGGPPATWPGLCATWLRAQRVVTTP